MNVASIDRCGGSPPLLNADRCRAAGPDGARPRGAIWPIGRIASLSVEPRASNATPQKHFVTWTGSALGTPVPVNVNEFTPDHQPSKAMNNIQDHQHPHSPASPPALPRLNAHDNEAPLVTAPPQRNRWRWRSNVWIGSIWLQVMLPAKLCRVGSVSASEAH